MKETRYRLDTSLKPGTARAMCLSSMHEALGATPGTKMKVTHLESKAASRLHLQHHSDTSSWLRTGLFGQEGSQWHINSRELFSPGAGWPHLCPMTATHPPLQPHNIPTSDTCVRTPAPGHQAVTTPFPMVLVDHSSYAATRFPVHFSKNNRHTGSFYSALFK